MTNICHLQWQTSPVAFPAIVTAYENSSQHDPSSNNAMLGVHASASAIIQYGKIARKQGLVNVALDILSRIHTIPTVPIVDCFQKIRQQVKCYLQLAGVMGKNECMQVGQRYSWGRCWNSWDCWGNQMCWSKPSACVQNRGWIALAMLHPQNFEDFFPSKIPVLRNAVNVLCEYIKN